MTWQAIALIVEQGVVVGLLLIAVRKFGQWQTARDRLTDSTNALIHELQFHRIAKTTADQDALNHTATFVYQDPDEKAS